MSWQYICVKLRHKDRKGTYYIVRSITWFSCKNKIIFSVSIYILKLNKLHYNMLLLSQQILGSNVQRDLSLVNIPSSKNLQCVIRNQHLEIPCVAKITIDSAGIL